MKSSDVIIIQPPKSQDKLDALKAFLTALKIKFEIASDYHIPQEHQDLVMERIKKSQHESLLDWDDVKDDFDGI